MWARRKLADRETHFYHVLTDTIITEYVERGVGTLAVSWPEEIRTSNWGKTGNKKLHTWAFDRIHQYLNYKGEERGVEVVNGNEWNTSKTCSRCGDDTKSNCVERGLYVCSSCELIGNAECNGAENMRQKITPNPHGEDRSNGYVAQPTVHLFDRESGRSPRENGSCHKPTNIPPCGTGSPSGYLREDVTFSHHRYGSQ